MKLIHLLIIVIMCVVSPAFAYDVSYSGHIKSRETISVKIYLPRGRSTIDVWSPPDHGGISCQFTNIMSGITIEQNNTIKCNLNIIAQIDNDITINITNLQNREVSWLIGVLQ